MGNMFIKFSSSCAGIICSNDRSSLSLPMLILIAISQRLATLEQIIVHVDDKITSFDAQTVATGDKP